MGVWVVDAALPELLQGHSGFATRIINLNSYSTTPVNEFTSLHSRAMTYGRYVQRIPSEGLYASSFPVFTVSGERSARIETTAPSSETDRSVSALVRRLIFTAIVFALLALVAGVLLGW